MNATGLPEGSQQAAAAALIAIPLLVARRSGYRVGIEGGRGAWRIDSPISGVMFRICSVAA